VATLGGSLLLFAAGWAAFVLRTSEAPERIRGRVVAVTAGDELLIVTSWGENRTVKLSGVEAPRGKSPIARASRRSLENLTAGYSVVVDVVGTRHEGALRGDVWLRGKNIAEAQVLRGMVDVKRNWLGNAEEHLLKAENLAEWREVGLWKDRSVDRSLLEATRSD
jgi:endonuclease YncB( thermonuclease family)